ncbi:ADP-ribosylglycohydrolase family protein [Rothia nasisuis]|uniref:ADP-ribosylglycohydrolase family protein n=1 Tax=Rothia nasisuis TaxID=2109647 RepID=UPI001F448448|nr:ADP-ribosylglycohydrolase family protein [Rothia nasisuis]
MDSVFPAPDALSPAYRLALRGSLYGTALGDALGYPAELLTVTGLYERYGVKDASELMAALGQGPLQVSDDTQLTLATLDGLTEVLEWNNEGQAADELACIWLSYLRWYTGTGHPAPPTAPYSLPRPLNKVPVMQRFRGPGKATLAALATGEMQFISKNINPQALGTGALMRSAPFGYLPVADDATVVKLATHAAALTHGHPEAVISAAAYALFIRYLLGVAGSNVKKPLSSAAQAVLTWLGTIECSKALPGNAALTIAAVTRAQELAATATPHEAARLDFGELVLATDCLGYALYLALCVEDQSRSPEALLHAVGLAIAVDGDSDSIGALVGSLLGALWGEEALPQNLIAQVDARQAIELAAAGWFTQLGL